MDLQSWAAFATILAALVASFAMTSRNFTKLDDKIDREIGGVRGEIDGVRGQIDAVHAKLDHKIDGIREELRAEVRDGFAKTEARLITLEQRTYDLSLRLPPATRPHTG